MTHPFDEIAVEAAANALCEALGYGPNYSKHNTVMWNSALKAISPALSAAFKSARDRGMVEEGHLQSGMDYLIHNEPLEGTTYPVTVIRHKEN